MPREPEAPRKFAVRQSVIVSGWALVVITFASQWYGYDAGHGIEDRFLYYLGWSFYLWGVLTPLALWLARRYPIEGGNWRRTVLLHVAASLLFTTVQLSVEALIAWFGASDESSLWAMVRHYLTEHTQIGLMSYWVVIGAAQFYRIHEQGRERELRAAQLEARLAAARMENLRAQLHPHFLFNTLQAAATLLHEDPRAAEDILLCLSELLRVSLEEMRTHEIPLAREIEFLEQYIGIQRRRFGTRLEFDLQIASDTLECAVPTLILQPLVENAVRHGVGKHKDADVVTVSAFRQRNQLCLRVANLSSSLGDVLERAPSRGVGLANTRGRLEQLYGSEQALSLYNLNPRGVCVQVSIPMHQALSDKTAPLAAT